MSKPIRFQAPAAPIWRLISDFGAAGQYLPGIVTCTVEGKGAGARRILTGFDGSMIVEQLETVNHAAHRLSYSLLTDTPFLDCLTTMTVRDLGSVSYTHLTLPTSDLV